MIICDDVHGQIRSLRFDELVASGMMIGVQLDLLDGSRQAAMVNCPRCKTTLAVPISQEEADRWGGR